MLWLLILLLHLVILASKYLAYPIVLCVCVGRWCIVAKCLNGSSRFVSTV